MDSQLISTYSMYLHIFTMFFCAYSLQNTTVCIVFVLALKRKCPHGTKPRSDFTTEKKGWNIEDQQSISWKTIFLNQICRNSAEAWFGFVMFCGNCLEDLFLFPFCLVWWFWRLPSTARTGEVQSPTALRSCCFVDHLTGPEAWTWVQTWCPQRYGSTWFNMVQGRWFMMVYNLSMPQIFETSFCLYK